MIWSWFDMNCQRFPNPKTSWWIFLSWGVYIVHPATVVLYHIISRRGGKKRTNQSKIHSPSPGNIQHDFLFPKVGDLNSHWEYTWVCNFIIRVATLKSCNSPLLGPSSDPARRRGAPRGQVNMTSLLQIFHLLIWPIFYILRKAKSIQNLRWLVLIPLHVLLFGWIVVVMDPLRVVPPCRSPVLHPPPLCCSAASPKHEAKHGHFAAQLPGTPPEKRGASHHLPGLTDVAHGSYA